MVPFSVTSWYSCARTLGEIRPGSNVARFRPRSLGSLAAGLAGSCGRTRFVIWFTTRFMTRFTTWETYPVRLWTLITRQRYTVGSGRPISLLWGNAAWSMRCNLVSVKVCLDHLGSSRACRSDLPQWCSSTWLPHLCTILLSMGIRSGFVSFVHQLRSVLSPPFPPATKIKFFVKYRTLACTKNHQ